MKVLLTTCNAKYIHKNLALRWIYTTCPNQEQVVLKEYTIKDQIERIVEEILAGAFDLVCFSCYIWNIDMTRDLIQLLKQKNPSIHILIGGPEVSFESFDLIESGVDAISIGEGEKSVWKYVEMLSSKQSYEVAGIYTKQHPNKEYQKVDLAWLEQFPNPYFLPFDLDDMQNRYFYFETSRGCPYGCTYCLSSADQQVRMFSEDYVFSILEQIRDSEIRQVKLLDRTFNSNPKRALRIARYMNTYCLKQIFQFEIVAETLSEELLDFFCGEADVNRFRFEIGVQSFHAKTLTSVGRIQNNQRLQEVIRRLKDARTTMHVDLIAGLPYEDIHQFQDSFDQLFALQASEVQLGILKLLKGTKLRSQVQEFGFQFSMQAPYDIQQTSWLSELELTKIHHCADAVEKFWNSGVLRYTITTILHKGYFKSPFALFMALGEEYANLTRPYQPWQLFACVKQVLPDLKEEELDAMLLMEYYANSKQRPKRFTKSYVTLEKKKELMYHCLESNIANQDRLFRYGVIDLGYDDGELCYQLVLYDKTQGHPRQYLITKELELKEWVKC